MQSPRHRARDVALALVLAASAPAALATVAGVRYQPVSTVPESHFTYDRITPSNRAHPEMQGGWGPHLRAVMSTADGRLWFADDQAATVDRNERVRYFERVDGTWQLVATNEFYPAFGRIQQNTSHFLREPFIFSYGVDVERGWLMECYLNVTDTTSRACNAIYVSGVPLVLPANTNYVGAALDSIGTKLVWWTRVASGGRGTFSYLYNFGSGWNGPVDTELAIGGLDYEFLAYLHLVFTAPSETAFVGETLRAGAFSAVTGRFSLGSPAELEVHPAISGADLWYDARTGDQHALLQGSTGLEYHHRPADGSWQAVQTLTGVFRGRFVFEEGSGWLHLITGSSGGGEGGLAVRTVEPTTRIGAFDWLDVPARPVPLPYAGFEVPNAIYNQSPSYQSAPVEGLRFGVVGQFGVLDHETWLYQSVPSCSP